MQSRWGYKGGQACQKVERFQYDVRGAVAIRVFQPIAYFTLSGEREPLDRDSGPAEVAREPFELRARVCFDADTGV